MKKTIIILSAAALLSLGLADGQNPVKDSSKVVEANGTVVINTTTLCGDVEGYMGPTPVEIRIRKDTIIDVKALPNEETPAYLKEAVKVLKKWVGLTTTQGLELEVDAISGATFSSDSLIDNVRAGLKRAIKK